MNRFDFYKDIYFRELDKKDQINSSISLPIGILTGLVASIFYLLSNFDYTFNYLLSGIFVITALVTIVYLIISVFYLIKSYNGFPSKYDYLLLPDNDSIETYYANLKAYYASTPSISDQSDKDLEEYLLKEMARNTGVNQRNNLRKTKYIYNCEKCLIIALIFIILSLPSFVIDYGLKTDKKKPIDINISSLPIGNIRLDSKENRNFILNLMKDSAFMKQLEYLQKPVAPPSQILTEGEDPRQVSRKSATHKK